MAEKITGFLAKVVDNVSYTGRDFYCKAFPVAETPGKETEKQYEKNVQEAREKTKAFVEETKEKGVVWIRGSGEVWYISPWSIAMIQITPIKSKE